ncbi:hypothetical protein PIB30_060737 [Stylosanthes scabra]|uniref:Uncharacterized protein n=1 Tax=Stylosanthes scabra TaxID=79078 RepID=A0ABU6RL06_9FABA|nr:hypothetical protein [Stylosanthes scabra]
MKFQGVRLRYPTSNGSSSVSGFVSLWRINERNIDGKCNVGLTGGVGFWHRQILRYISSNVLYGRKGIGRNHTQKTGLVTMLRKSLGGCEDCEVSVLECENSNPDSDNSTCIYR